MKVNHKITGAEREVMEVLWQRTEPMQTRELLEEKGSVSRKRAYVEAALSQEELLQVQTQELLDDFYGGEYGNFFAALTGNKEIDSESKRLLDGLMKKLKK